MARGAQPLYMVSRGGYKDFNSLLHSGDLATMKGLAEETEKWLQNPENSKGPEAAEERKRLEELKAEIKKLDHGQTQTAKH